MQTTYTLEDVQQLLWNLIAEHGGTQAAAADALGVSRQYINACLTGRTLPSGAVLRALGLKKVVGFAKETAP